MRTAVVTALVAASSLLALPALTSSAPAAPAAPVVAQAGEGTLTICFVGLGRDGKIQPTFGIEGLESGQATSSTMRGYVRQSGCFTERVNERTRFSFSFPAKDPYRLRSVRSEQNDGEDARVTVSRGLGVRVVIDEGDDVTVTLSYGKPRR